MQTKRGSLTEAFVNVLVGYWISVAANMAILPLFGLRASIGENMAIGLAFTVISLVRSYVLRRIFNRLHR